MTHLIKLSATVKGLSPSYGGLWILGLIMLSILAASCGVNEPKPLEEQAQSIDKQLMCPVCPAETIDQAQVPLAREMRAFVREKLAEGWTRQAILDYFSAPERYGTKVLAEPPKSGTSLMIWTIPPIGFLLGGVLIFFTIRAMLRRPSGPAKDLLPTESDLEPYLEQVDAEMEARTRTRPYKRMDSDGESESMSPKTNDEGASHG